MKATYGKTIESNVRQWFKENYPATEYGRGKQRYQSAYRELEYGCASGVVSHLIYYGDTSAFFKKFRSEINSLLAELDVNPADITDWDKEDPLACETHNQNLLAWFGFETVGLRWLEANAE